jgi:hypothetical protein
MSLTSSKCVSATVLPSVRVAALAHAADVFARCTGQQEQRTGLVGFLTDSNIVAELFSVLTTAPVTRYSLCEVMRTEATNSGLQR